MTRDMARTRALIPPAELSAIQRATRGDARLYAAALDVFWRRVAVMARVTGHHVPELPAAYRRG